MPRPGVNRIEPRQMIDVSRLDHELQLSALRKRFNLATRYFSPRRDCDVDGQYCISGGRTHLVHSWDQPRGPFAVCIILIAELAAEQRLFSANADEERRNGERREQHADPGTELKS